MRKVFCVFAVFTIAVVVLSSATTQAQSAIELKVEGQSTIDQNSTVTGDLTVGGTINAGSTPNQLTNAAGLLDGSKIQSGTIGTTQIATGAATEASIATGAVTSDKIADGAVATADVADSAITSAKIADGAVATADIADSAITSVKISDGTVATTDLAANAVTTAKIADATIATADIADSAITTAKIADNTIAAADIASSAIITDKIADDNVTPEKIDDTLTYGVGKLGIGTSVVPYAGYGHGQFAIKGSTGTYGPSMYFTTGWDDYPVFGVQAANHDNMGIRFDCYFYNNGTNHQASSYSGSNAEILKYQNSLYLMYASGVTAGSDLTWSSGFRMSCTDGSIVMPAVYSQTVGATRRLLYIDDTGKIGYVASTQELKENIRSASTSDTSFIYDLRPVVFDYKDRNLGVNQCGLIAEEVDKVCPRIVSYKREVISTPPAPSEDDPGLADVSIKQRIFPKPSITINWLFHYLPKFSVYMRRSTNWKPVWRRSKQKNNPLLHQFVDDNQKTEVIPS